MSLDDELIPGDLSKSRFMSQKKKKYYLASVEENVEVLRKEQIEDLTKVLIGLKSELNALHNECENMKKETVNIEKKMNLIERIDDKTKEKTNQLEETNDIMKEAITMKKILLKEEKYITQTLSAQIDKLKTDILLQNKELTDAEDYQSRLKARYQKEKFFENDVKEKYNSVYSKIIAQKKKNNFDRNEYNLQIQYYNTIIEQKWMFIQSADERKERQKRIQQEAKNDTQDKQEIDRRHKIHMLYLVDKYLGTKMKNNIKKNSEIEEIFRQIKIICGTSNLKKMVDKILTKDKRYNYLIGKIMDKEVKKNKLKKEIKDLEEEFEGLKTEIVVDENTVNKQNVQIIPSVDVESNTQQLIDEEKELTELNSNLKELHHIVKVKYEKVIRNIKKYLNMSEDKTETDEEYIKGLTDYLNETEKKINMLFLCHSKAEFINMLREKGIEEMLNETPKNFGEVKSSRATSGVKNASTADNELDYGDDNNNNTEENKIQEEIFQSYMNNINMKRDMFIQNQKEEKRRKKE